MTNSKYIDRIFYYPSLDSVGTIATAGKSVQVLDEVAAASAAPIPYTGTTQVEFATAVGANAVPPQYVSGPDCMAPIVEADASEVQCVASNSNGCTIEAYKASLEAINSGVATNADLITFFQNATLLYQAVGEDVTFINPLMYSKSYVIKTADYAEDKPQGAKYAQDFLDLCSGNVRRNSPNARRLAVLTKALKDSVLAQTNDTNPFYSMPVAELYDRLVDYFTRINRYMASWHNAKAMCSIADAVRDCAHVYWKEYQKMYSPANTAKLEAALTKLQTLLLGQYADHRSLMNYMQCATISLAPVQTGGFKLYVPSCNARDNSLQAASTTTVAREYILSNTLTRVQGANKNPDDWMQSIVDWIEEACKVLNSAEVSIIRTGLLAFNGVPTIDSVEFKGLTYAIEPARLNAVQQKWAVGEFSVCTKILRQFHVGPTFDEDHEIDQSNVSWTDNGIYLLTPAVTYNDADDPSIAIANGDSITTAGLITSSANRCAALQKVVAKEGGEYELTPVFEIRPGYSRDPLATWQCGKLGDQLYPNTTDKPCYNGEVDTYYRNKKKDKGYVEAVMQGQGESFAVTYATAKPLNSILYGTPLASNTAEFSDELFCNKLIGITHSPFSMPAVSLAHTVSTYHNIDKTAAENDWFPTFHFDAMDSAEFMTTLEDYLEGAPHNTPTFEFNLLSSLPSAVCPVGALSIYVQNLTSHDTTFIWTTNSTKYFAAGLGNLEPIMLSCLGIPCTGLAIDKVTAMGGSRKKLKYSVVSSGALETSMQGVFCLSSPMYISNMNKAAYKHFMEYQLPKEGWHNE